MALSKTQIYAIIVVIIVIVAACAVVVVASDDDDDDDDTGTSGSSSSSSDTSDDDDYYADGVYIENNVASSTTYFNFTLYEKPSSVFVCMACNIELLCYFGLEDLIVGAYVRPNAENYTCMNSELQDAYDSVVERLGDDYIYEYAATSWSSEVVASYDPDMIIGWSSTFSDSYIGSFDYWQSIGVNCVRTNVYGNASGTSIETYYDLMTLIGDIFNEGDKADAAIEKWQGFIEDITEKTSSLTDDEKPRVLVVDNQTYDDVNLCVYGTEMLTGCLVEAAGGICIGDGRMEDISMEVIAYYDVDIVILVGCGYYTTFTDEEYQEQIDWWNSLTTLEGLCDNVVALPMYQIYMGGILDDDILNILYDLFYPDA